MKIYEIKDVVVRFIANIKGGDQRNVLTCRS